MGTANILSISKCLLIVILFSGCKSTHSLNTDQKKQINGDPVIRIYPNKVENLSFDNLRFFRIMAVNSPNSPEIMSFQVNGFNFTYNGQSFYSETGAFTSEFINKIYADRPATVSIQTVDLTDQNKQTYKRKTDIIISLSYTNGNNYSCLESKKSIDFKTLMKTRKNDEILIQKNENECPILCFYNLGSIFSVEITSFSDEILYKKTLKAGEITIDNYFIIPDENGLNVKITGDYNWQGKIKF